MQEYPWYVKATAIWLYTRHELSSREVADRLGIAGNTVSTWVRAEGLSRSLKVACQIDHQKRNPELFKRRVRCRQLREQGLTMEKIAKIVGVSASQVFHDLKAAAQYDISNKVTYSRIEPIKVGR